MRFELNLWEFEGSHVQALRGLKDRLKSLPDPAVFLICFSIASPLSLALAEQKVSSLRLEVEKLTDVKTVDCCT